jgi:quaternary ammonium compound-resistance protein SugE
MAWFLLICAGLLEVVWAVSLKYTEGFRRPGASAVVAVALIGSMLLLGMAVRTLPIGTAYAIWVGIGALGAAVLGMLLFDEPATPARVACLILLVLSILGLKLSS